MLLFISQEFEDPFGDDYSDIRLRRQFVVPLLRDFQRFKVLELDKKAPVKPLEPNKKASDRGETTAKYAIRR